MSTKTIKFTIGSRTYEIKKKHVVYAAIATSSYIAIMYKNRCAELTQELAKVVQEKDSCVKYASTVSERAVSSGIATLVDKNGRQHLVFEYEV